MLLCLARTPIAGAIIGWVLAHLSFAIPVRRLRETASLLAFHHPRPSYPVHILLVPKKGIASLAALTGEDAGFVADLLATVQGLVREFGMEKAGYRLIVNGGRYQDVAQLHFHLVSGQGTASGGLRAT